MKLTNPNDWLEITIKFRGKCCECGKEITSGQALWSKSTKAVKQSRKNITSFTTLLFKKYTTQTNSNLITICERIEHRNGNRTKIQRP